ncbi:hypothetical protein CCR75_007523 [Bremia lactucae]|uniref:UVR domain-containing protein n=1 Tax=Bremia lactucae TaxID=4779 RepID=A0A976IBS9_BRELC|nr:hypothetical protein CCR75_007523 [Bremia lactucae]
MFGRFFKNKEDGKNGPPGHQRQGGQNGTIDDPPVGGGFFNLPPPVAKPYGTSNPTALNNFVPSSGTGGYPPSVTYGNSSTQDNTAVHGSDMFGGMAVREPSAAKPIARYQPQHPNQYGGNGGAPQSAANAPHGTSGNSLFTGLAVASVPMVSVSDASTHVPIIPVPDDTGASTIPTYTSEHRKSMKSSRLIHHNEGGNTDALSSSQFSRTSAGSSSATSKSSLKGGKKKKKKTFRPGFGRQLSDESAAALQRGDIKEDEVILQQQQEKSRISDHSDTSRNTRLATNPTDLAHLLPPVKSGSVLQGLTVHHGSKKASGGSVLAGLTVHTPASPALSVPKNEPSADYKPSNLLSGLSIQKTPSTIRSEKSLESVTVIPEVECNDEPVQLLVSTPASPITPENRLLHTLRDFHESAVGFRQLTAKQNEEENRLLERKVHLTSQLTQFELDLRDVEAQQHHACEVEDFEKADALNATINSVRHCISLTESDVRKVESELVAFLKAKEKAFANQLKSTRGTLRELESFCEDQESERTIARNEYKLYHLNQTQQLQFEAERIETEMHHVSVSLENVIAEKSEIEATIEGQCSTEFAIQVRLSDEKKAVEEEVRELERKLKDKRKRVEAIQSSIDSAQRDINTVRKRYSRQLKRIAEREEGIKKTKAEVESDGKHLAQQRVDFEKQIQQYTDTVAVIGKRIGAVKEEMRAATLLANVLEVQETRREQAILRKKQQTAELSSLNDAAAIAEQSFTMLRKQHEELEKSSAIHRNAIASAEAMIPRLEQEKKGAAAQRNFKEAARISKDIKALEKDRSTAEEMVEVVEMEMHDLNERIDKRQVEFEEKKQELKKMQKRLELATLHELWKEAKHLRTALHKIEKHKSEGDAASDGMDFRSSAILLIQAEYDACMLQVESFEKKYDVSDPAKDEPVEEEDDHDDELIDGDENDRSDHVLRSSLIGRTTDGSALDGNVEDLEDSSSALKAIEAQLYELESKIEIATENEEYELAARLDEKIEILKERQRAIKVSNPVTDACENSVDEADEEDEEESMRDDLSDDEDEMEEEYGHEEMVSPRIEEEKVLSFETNEVEAVMLKEQVETSIENKKNGSVPSHQEELQSMREEERYSGSQLEAGDSSVTVPHKFKGQIDEITCSSAAEAVDSRMLEHILPQQSTHTSKALFGGLQMSPNVVTNATEVLILKPNDESLEREVEASATSEIFSPTSSNMKDSFFGNPDLLTQQASQLAHSASPFLFNGLHMSGSLSVSPLSSSVLKNVLSEDGERNVDASLIEANASASDDVFGGLQLSSSVVTDTLMNATRAFEVEELPLNGATSSKRALKEVPTDMFGGLKLSSSAPSVPMRASSETFGGPKLGDSVVTATSVSFAKESLEEEVDGVKRDEEGTRMSIHELTEHETEGLCAEAETTMTIYEASADDTQILNGQVEDTRKHDAMQL